MSNAGKPVARMGDNVTTGHACDTTTKIADNFTPTRVIVEGEPAATVGMNMEFHTIQGGLAGCIPHVGQIVNAGSAKVLVGGKGIARLGDSADLGAISTACPNGSVLAG